MAQMCPHEIPSKASQGEKRLFQALSGLPDNCIVYYEAKVHGLYPDFIVIVPELGILVIEVKGWYLKNIKNCNDNFIEIEQDVCPENQANPFRQVREYVFGLMDELKGGLYAGCLRHDSGVYQGKLIFPIVEAVVFSNISRSEVESFGTDVWDKIFPFSQVVYREQLLSMERDPAKETLRWIVDVIESNQKFPLNLVLNNEQVDIIRGMIHREIRIRKSSFRSTNPAVQDFVTLDLIQEQLCRSIGDGHRILFGVAGSGKTLILMARAKYLAERNPDFKILILCFNVTLSFFIRSQLGDLGNVTVFHIDGWAKSIGHSRKYNEKDSQFANRLFTKISNGLDETAKYDAVMIDEAQDFEPGFFQAARLALKDQENGDLLIVADGHQGLRKTNKISWKSLGIKAVGRTISAKLNLKRNYRNTKEIVAVASRLLKGKEIDDADGIGAIAVSPDAACRVSGYVPNFKKASSHAEECHEACKTVSDWLSGTWNGKALPRALDAQEIGILYPSCRDDQLMSSFLERLGKMADVIWISDRQKKENRGRVCDPGIKVQTVHSAKGLQYKGVILLWADLVPDDIVENSLDASFFYVAMTRAEEYLSVSYSNPVPAIYSAIEGIDTGIAIS